MKYLLALFALASSSLAWAAPVNDTFSSASVAGTGVHSGSNSAATSETGEPVHAKLGGGKSVWWSWTPTTSGTATISTAGSAIDTVLAVYTGSSVSALTPVAYSDDENQSTLTSKVTFTVNANTTYRIAVDGYNGAAGTFQLTISLGGATTNSQNDNYADRAPIAGDYAIVSGSSQSATTESGENSLFVEDTTDDIFSYWFVGTKSVWWTWTAPRSGSVTITNTMIINPEFNGDYLDAAVEIFTTNAATITDLERYPIGKRSTDFGSVETVSITRNVLAGQVLQIKLSSYDATYGARIKLTVDMDPSGGNIVNDRFVKRAGVASAGATLTSSNVGATADVGEPTYPGSVTASNSLWWSWVAPANGYVDIDTLGSLTTDNHGLDTTMAVYTGSSLAGLTLVAGNDDSSVGLITTSRVRFAVTKGEAYSIGVDSKGVDGTVALNVNFISQSIVLTSPPQDLSVDVNAPNAVFTVSHTGGVAVYDWQRSIAGTNNWVHYSNGVVTTTGVLGSESTSTLTITGSIPATMNGDKFRCVITNPSGQVTTKAATLTVVSGMTSVGIPQSINVVPLQLPAPSLPATITYYASGLPKGLSIDKNTGLITGRITAKSGSYTVSYWSITANGSTKTKSPVYSYVLNVLSYPSAIVGSFEGLFLDALTSTVSVGKVEALVASGGTFSGKVTYAAKVYSFKGVLNIDASTTFGTATVALKDSLVLVLRINDDQTMTATLSGIGGLIGDVGSDGAQVKKYFSYAPPAWSGNYTLAWTDPSAGPEGAGYARAVVDGEGQLLLKGKLSDGTLVTGATKGDVSSPATYRHYIQLYSSKAGYLSGWLPLTLRSGSTTLYHVAEGASDGFFWRKPANAKDKLYPAGFGPVVLDVVMEPWTRPTNKYLLGLLGLVPASDSSLLGDFSLTLKQTGSVANTGLNTLQLPVKLTMSTSALISVDPTDLNPTNPRSLLVSVNSETGLFTGSFVLPGVKTKVALEGVLMQLPTGTSPNLLGRGFYLAPQGDGTTLSGEVIFTGP